MLAQIIRAELYCHSMQAGDKLKFITPFDVFAPKTDPSDSEREARMDEFAVMMRQLVFDRPENITSFEVLEEAGFVTVFEASYRLDMPDGSYLHIVGFGHLDEEGLLDAGVSVIEHTDDGVYNGGYVYSLKPDGVSRTTAPPDSENSNMDAEDRRRHFSVADLYQGRDELDQMEQSDIVEEVIEAVETRAALAGDALMARLAVEMGADGLAPREGELARLTDLIKDAYPFPLNQRAA